jgi:GINS complex subunit 4
MDIDDILADLESTHPSLSAGRDGKYSAQTDLQMLTRAFVAERAAPEVLEYPQNLMDRIMNRIGRQVC